MIVVIAEKPSVARDLARVMGATKANQGYIEGNGYAFTWAFGHMVELASPAEYGYSYGKHLPMFPEFKLVVGKDKSGNTDKDKVKQLKTIDTLFRAADKIVVATDAGREGELIFRYIYSYLGIKKSWERLWISSQTDRAITEGFKSLKKGSDFDSLYAAAKSRSESDWIVGMNGSQALTVAVNNGDVYSIGRVQTPTLVLICERFIENTRFVPQKFYQFKITLDKNKALFSATSTQRWDKKAEADSIFTQVGATAKVKKLEKKKREEPTPLLYDLTTLQREANRKYSFTADETLEAAQNLYMNKLITYPRTSSRYISEDVYEQIPDLIKEFKSDPVFGKAVTELMGKKLNRRSVNDEKVTDHHALLPTEVQAKPKQLEGKEGVIYAMIVARLLESFGESCVKEVTNVLLHSGVDFAATGTRIVSAGWRTVLGLAADQDEEQEGSLPDLQEGEELPIVKKNVHEGQTKPRPIHTEDSLLSAMETCGKEVEDEELREAMKETGIGTAVTRSKVIVDLLDRDYVVRDKKKLVPTKKGLYVFNIVKDKRIGRPVLTGEWEKKMSDIQKGTFSRKDFMEGIKQYTIELTTELMEETTAENTLPKCPKCGGTLKIVSNPKLDALLCETEKANCGFILWRTVAKKKLTDEQLIELIEKGTTGLIKGFVSAKTGNKFDAKLRLDESFKAIFEFEERK